MFMLFPTGLSSSPSASIDKVAALSARSGFPAPGWLAIPGLTLLFCSCATTNNRSFAFDSVPAHSCVDHDGKQLRHPDGEFPDSYRYERHLERMSGNLAKFHERNSAAGEPTKVLISTHDGLNSGPATKVL